jgi:DNA-3-methyladenine glycosylase
VERPPPLPRAFYARPPLEVAPELIGAMLWHESPEGETVAAMIVETEAYLGPADRASHTRAGRTTRTAPMFGPPGHAYVYRLYGMHWAFNVVAHAPDAEAGAVLVRAALPVEGIGVQRLRRGRAGDPVERLAAGPGRLCQALGIEGTDTGRDLTAGAPLWIGAAPGASRPGALPPGRGTRIVTGPRINVAYAGEPWVSAPYRFGLAGSPALSVRFPARAGVVAAGSPARTGAAAAGSPARAGAAAPGSPAAASPSTVRDVERAG